jgi:hypothetical protein
MSLLDGIEKFTFFLLLLVFFVSPWTKGIASLFSLSTFEEESVFDMTIYLIQKMPASLYYNGLLFLLPPFLLLLLRLLQKGLSYAVSSSLCRSHPLLFKLVLFLKWADLPNLILCFFSAVAMCVSFILLPLLLVPTPDPGSQVRQGERSPIDTNYMGNLLSTDFFLMGGFHSFLVLQGSLPPSSLAGGPLFGLSLFLLLPEEKRRGKDVSSLPLSLFLLYTCIGALFNAFSHFDSVGSSLLEQSFPFSQWYGYELYSLATIVGGFLLISSSIPLPTTPLQLIEAVVYIVLLNANVAAGWAFSAGYFRPPLLSPSFSLPFWRRALSC